MKGVKGETVEFTPHAGFWEILTIPVSTEQAPEGQRPERSPRIYTHGHIDSELQAPVLGFRTQERYQM